MKAKVYLFRLIVGVSAFVFGAAIYSMVQYFQTKTIAEEFHFSVQPDVLPLPAQIAESSNETKEDEIQPEDEFYPDGEYYLIDDLPKGFKNFGFLSIEANDWSYDSGTDTYPPKPIIPKGYLQAGKEYKFTKISINKRLISFETEKKNGIYYTFIGDFPTEPSTTDEDWVDLQGVLTKYQKGKKTVKINIKLGAGGC